MADSDSDQFESADEEFSGSSDSESPQPRRRFSSDETKKSVVTNRYVSSALKNLSLQDSNLSAGSSLAKEKQSVCLSEKISDSTTTETPKHTNFEEELTINEPKQSSYAEAVDSRSEILNSSSISTGSLRPVKDLTGVLSLKSTPVNKDTVGITTNVKLSSDYSESNSSNSSPFSSSQSKNSFETSKTPPDSAFKSQFHQNVKQPLPQVVPSSIETNKGFETVISSVDDEAETEWKDGWEEDSTFATSVNVESRSVTSETSLPPATLEPSRNNSKKDHCDASSSNENRKTKSVQNEGLEKTPESQLSHPVLKSSETVVDSKFSMKSREENISESSWNEGWEEDFEIEDAPVDDAKSLMKKKEIVMDSGLMDDGKDGWNDGWDTEDVTFSPELSKSLEKGEVQVPNPNKPETKSGISTTTERIDKGITNQSNILTPNRKTAEKQVWPQQQQPQDGWFGWGVTNILSTATEGLSTITSNVTSAFESTIGAPDPEDILRAQNEQGDSGGPFEAPKEGSSEATKPEDGSTLTSNLFSVSSWTKFVESTGSKVLTTGLDTLETIGKKTMEVLQEGDPGLKNKRAKLCEFVSEPGKPVLSQVLREAKEKAETSSRKNEAALIESRANFEILFDDFEGLVHLEALEMISKQCQIKLDSLALTFSGNEAKNFKETLQEVEELCELPEDDESFSKEAMADSNKFKLAVCEVLAKLDVDIQYAKLLEASELVENRLTKDYTNPLELHQIAISSLAEISAAAMLVFHRAAEMLVIKQKHSTIAETDSLMSFGALVCSKLQVTADKFSSKLTTMDPSDNTKVSHIAKEAVNSITYTQTACQQLVSILQYGAAV